MISVTPTDEDGINPVPLDECIMAFSKNKDTYLRIAVLTADNKPHPYFIVQLYQNPEKPKYILNWAVYPDRNALNKIVNNEFSCVDYILGGLNLSSQQINVYRVENGQDYTDALYANQSVLERIVGTKLDPVIRSWLSAH